MARAWIPLALFVALAWPAHLRAQQKVLPEAEITEQAIVDALKPAPEESLPSGRRKRSFRPALATIAPPRQASMLITFATDSATLTPSARSALDVVVRALKSSELASANFSVEGHADPRGGDEHNLRLSRQRADSVVSYLVQEGGLPSERLQAVGKGSSELMNKAVPTAAENRRVTIVAHSKGD
jgi:outer membrane protein OmpA-like peptidoglycan-associated protein